MSWALLFFKAVLVYEGRREVWETVQGWDTNKGRMKKQRAGNDDGDIILGAFEDSVLMWEVDLHTHTCQWSCWNFSKIMVGTVSSFLLAQQRTCWEAKHYLCIHLILPKIERESQLCDECMLGKFQTPVLLANCLHSLGVQPIAGAISCILMPRCPHSTRPPWARLQSWHRLPSWRETSGHFAITSEIYMLFWTLIHTFPSHFSEEADGSSCQARKMKSLPSVFGLGWLFIADSVLRQVCLPGFDY